MEDNSWHNYRLLEHINNWLIDRELLSLDRTEEQDGELAAGLNITDSIEKILTDRDAALAENERLRAKLKTTEDALDIVTKSYNERYPALEKECDAALAENERLREHNRRLGVHLSHCNHGEYEGTCKYGDEDCPALTETWSWFGMNLQQNDRLSERLAELEWQVNPDRMGG